MANIAPLRSPRAIQRSEKECSVYLFLCQSLLPFSGATQTYDAANPFFCLGGFGGLGGHYVSTTYVCRDHCCRPSHKLSWLCRYNVLHATNNAGKQRVPSASGNAEDGWRGEALGLKIVMSERVMCGDPYLAAKHSFSLLLMLAWPT